MLRRQVLSGLSLVGLSLSSRLASAKTEELPEVSLGVRIVRASGVDVVTAPFVEAQIAETNAIFGGFGVKVRGVSHAALDADFSALEDREDRNRLSEHLVEKHVSVFFVSSLRDVDDPKLLRMGVTWRNLRNLKQRYVIVASTARPTTLAHELGHYFGLPHTSVKNNLMSYDRDGGTVFLDEAQAKKVRQGVQAAHRSKELS